MQECPHTINLILYDIIGYRVCASRTCAKKKLQAYWLVKSQRVTVHCQISDIFIFDIYLYHIVLLTNERISSKEQKTLITVINDDSNDE